MSQSRAGLRQAFSAITYGDFRRF
ncbi:uncharacterized protein METZ01_LOCUS314057, partial [marine metagenome]